MADTKLKALITLLDDPDPEVYDVVFENLLNKGLSIVPELEKAWEKTNDQLLHYRIENIIQTVQYESTRLGLQKWIKTGGQDIVEGAFWIAKYQFPDINLSNIKNQIELIYNDACFEMNDNLTPLEKIKVLNHVFFHIHRFARNTSNFFSPQNCYINHVLDVRKGNPISLSVIYAAVAQKLELPVYGVNLPRNFLLAYVDEDMKESELPEDKVQFYINPFNKGAILGRREIHFFIKHQRLEKKASYYAPCNNLETIKQLIANLIFSYEKLGYHEKITDLKEFLELFNDI